MTAGLYEGTIVKIPTSGSATYLSEYPGDNVPCTLHGIGTLFCVVQNIATAANFEAEIEITGPSGVQGYAWLWPQSSKWTQAGGSRAVIGPIQISLPGIPLTFDLVVRAVGSGNTQGSSYLWILCA